MPLETFDLPRLIAPIEPEQFFAEHWEQRWLYVPHDDPSRYANLFGPGDVDALLHFGRPRFSDADSVGRPPGSTVLRGLPAEAEPAGAGRIGLIEMRKLYAQGRTVLVHSLQLRVPAVAALSRSLEQALQCPINVNMYLTPPGAQGFSAHMDDHDVFIAQLEGEKHWRLYGSVRELPLKFETILLSNADLPEPVQEIRLRAGDLLYLPRGAIHEVFTSDQASLHLTIGVEVFRWADLLARAVASLARREPAMRRVLPVGWIGAGAGSAEMQDRFREVLRLVANRADLSEAVADLGAEFIGGLATLPDGRFSVQPDGDGVQLDTRLEKRPGTICQVVEDGASASIQFPGNRIGGPAAITPALRVLADSAGPFTARSLPGDLSDNSKLILVRRLVAEGLLTPAATSS